MPLLPPPDPSIVLGVLKSLEGNPSPTGSLLGGGVLRLLSLSYILAVSSLPGVHSSWWVEATLAQRAPGPGRVPPRASGRLPGPGRGRHNADDEWGQAASCASVSSWSRGPGSDSGGRYFLRPNFIVNKTGLIVKLPSLGLQGDGNPRHRAGSHKCQTLLPRPPRALRTNFPKKWAQGRWSPKCMHPDTPYC